MKPEPGIVGRLQSHPATVGPRQEECPFEASLDFTGPGPLEKERGKGSRDEERTIHSSHLSNPEAPDNYHGLRQLSSRGT